jgi:hypothetical protein
MAVTFASNTLFSGADMSASFQSDEINLHNMNGFSIHAIFTGSPTGTAYVAVSIDGENWITLTDSSQALSAAGDIFWNVNTAKYKLARLHYTRSSGSGSMNAFFNTKEAQ